MPNIEFELCYMEGLELEIPNYLFMQDFSFLTWQDDKPNKFILDAKTFTSKFVTKSHISYFYAQKELLNSDAKKLDHAFFPQIKL